MLQALSIPSPQQYPNHRHQLNHHRRESMKGLEKLIDKIFEMEGYNELVRPVNNLTGLTHVRTELKLLGIDLDEKYQELVSTVWVEMVSSFFFSILY